MKIWKKQGLLVLAAVGLVATTVLALLLATSSAVLAAKPAPPPSGTDPGVRYSIRWLDLEAPEVFTDPTADIWSRGVNNLGDVVGYTAHDSTEFGWVYTKETGVFDVGDVALSPDELPIEFKYCNSINDRRQIAGGAIYDGTSRAIRLTLPLNEDGTLSIDPATGLPPPTRVEVLPPPAGSVGQYTADRINNDGYVSVIWTEAAGSRKRVSLYAFGTGYIDTSATKHPDWRTDLNDDGVIVGTQLGSDGREYAFRSILDPAGEVSFRTLDGWVQPTWVKENVVSQTTCVNSVGQICGAALKTTRTFRGAKLVAESSVHAFIWHDETGMIDLGTLGTDTSSRAIGMNTHGDVVGSSGCTPYDTMSGGRPFLWTPETKMYSLDRLVADPTGRWATAADISGRPNDPPTGQRFGQIYGRGTVGGRIRPFLLTPSGL